MSQAERLFTLTLATTLNKIESSMSQASSPITSLTSGMPGLHGLLKKGGLTRVKDLAFANTYVTSKLLRLSISQTRLLQRAAISKVQKLPDHRSFITAHDVFQTRTTDTYSTGLIGLDRILAGGIETGTITQLFGAPGTCKTQLCYKLCTQLPADCKAIYIDTEGKFRPERIRYIATSRNLDDREILNRIIVSKPFQSTLQEESIESSYSMVKRDPKIKLMIVDSMTNHYLAEYPGRKFLQARMNKLSTQIHILLSIARLNNIAVIITNRPHSILSDDQMEVKDLMPYGGNALSSTSTHILHMKRISRRNEYTAKLVKSPAHANTSASFAITSSGIEDIANDKPRI